MLSTLKKALRSQGGKQGFYEPKRRYRHSVVILNKDLYIWGGDQDDLPKVHSSDLKLRLTSVAEVFRGRVGRWSQHKTTGPPPNGVIGCASCVIGSKIYYCGGCCNYDKCYHNSLHELDVDDFKWTVRLPDQDNGPMKKCDCGMVAIHHDLLFLGGRGIPPRNPQPLAQYDGEGLGDGVVRTNELHLLTFGADHWMSPNVTGDKPPPLSGFTLSKIADEKVLLFGGLTSEGPSSDLRVVTILGGCVQWEKLVPHGPERPRGRWGHAVSIIHSTLMGDQKILLLVTGGVLCSDAWLLDVTGDASWRKVKDMPLPVTERCWHSMSMVTCSHSCAWLIAAGGTNAWFGMASSCAFLELNLSHDGEWEVTSFHEGEEIYQGYVERFTLKFPAHCQMDSAAAAALVIGRNRELEQELQHAHAQIEAMRRDVKIKEQQLQFAQQQLHDKDLQIRENEWQIQQSKQQLHEKDEQIQANSQLIRDKDMKLEHAQQQFQQQLQEKERSLQHSLQQVQQMSSNLVPTDQWMISREELALTEELLGSGGYGEVRVALFGGLRVAAKTLHTIVASDYNLRLFSREMSIAAQVRHPNLLLFIGATSTQGQSPIILTELMPTSLYAQLQQGQISHQQIEAIAIDVCCGLRYLHEKKPNPIVHRDVSSPNILMQPLDGGYWRAKVSDYGSANFVCQVTNNSVYPGNPSYSAPEASSPAQHSTKMDVYSFGVLLTEMCLHEPPKLSHEERVEQFRMVPLDSLADIISTCTDPSPDQRPSIARVMDRLTWLTV